MSAAWPVVAERLVELFRAIPGEHVVFDGQPVTSEAPQDYVTVGYVPNADAGSYAVEAIYDYQQRESGTVVSQVVAQSGDPAELSDCRARVFALAEALRVAIRADHTLGVLSPDGTTSVSADVLSVQNASGTAQALAVSVSYTTRH